MKAIILTDGKAGHENQSRALAAALGLEAETLAVGFRSAFHKALSYALDRAGVLTLSLFRPFAVPDEAPAVVVGTGSGTFYAAKALARRLRRPCAVVLYPRGYRLSTFDCVLAPFFDRPASAPNVVELPVNLVPGDDAFYARGAADFAAHCARTRGRAPDPARPAAAVIVGGPNKCSTMTAGWMRARLDEIFAANRGKAMWVTTSRRTPSDVEDVVDSYPWDYALIYSRDRFNPIPGFVRLAETLYVTAESTGMLSEACSFGSARVVPLDNLRPGSHKFRRFVEGLEAEGYAARPGGGGGVRKADLSRQFARAAALLGLGPLAAKAAGTEG